MTTLGLFKSNIHLVASKDDLRPALTMIHFKNGYVYVTDATILIKQSLKWMGFEDEAIKMLNGKSISAVGFSMLRTASVLDIREEGIRFRYKKALMQVNFEEDPHRYPDVEKVIAEILGKKAEAVDVVALMPDKVKKLLSAMYFESHFLAHFRGKNQGIQVVDAATDAKDQMAIIMPCMLY